MKKEEKIEEKTKKTFSKLKIIKITVISTIIILAIIALSIYIYNKNKKLDITYITAQLEKSSELTTATLKFKGIYDYEDSGRYKQHKISKNRFHTIKYKPKRRCKQSKLTSRKRRQNRSRANGNIRSS